MQNFPNTIRHERKLKQNWSRPKKLALLNENLLTEESRESVASNERTPVEAHPPALPPWEKMRTRENSTGITYTVLVRQGAIWRTNIKIKST